MIWTKVLKIQRFNVSLDVELTVFWVNNVITSIDSLIV